MRAADNRVTGFLSGVVDDLEERIGGKQRVPPSQSPRAKMLERYMKHHAPEKEGEEAAPPPSQTARLRMSLSRSVAREGSFRTPQRGGGAAGEPSTANGSPQSDVLAQLVVASKIQRRDQIAAKSSGSPKKKKAPKFNPMNRAPGVRVTSRQIRDYLKPERPRLTPRELVDAQKQWRDAVLHRWLTIKAGHHLPRTKLSEERIEALRECFQLMDADNSGQIDFSELATAMRALGFSNAEIREAITSGDTDGDGQLDFQEFVNLIASTGGGGKDSDSDNAFPFSLVAESYRISRLVDSYKPIDRTPHHKPLPPPPPPPEERAPAPAPAAAAAAAQSTPARPPQTLPPLPMASPRPYTSAAPGAASPRARPGTVSFAGDSMPATPRGRSRRGPELPHTAR